jgi:hypothetical protein
MVELRSFKGKDALVDVDLIIPDSEKDLVMYLRLSPAIAFRLNRQCTRLGCAKNIFARMAVIKMIEEEEINEPKPRVKKK